MKKIECWTIPTKNFCKINDFYFAERTDLEKSAVLLAHGTPEGKIILNGERLSPENALRQIIAMGIIKNGVNTIYSVSCYGGKQQKAFAEGKCLKSSHPIRGQIAVFLYGDKICYCSKSSAEKAGIKVV